MASIRGGAIDKKWPEEIPHELYPCVDKLLGPLHIGAPLGRGAYGQLWRVCKDSELSDCPYALKQSIHHDVSKKDPSDELLPVTCGRVRRRIDEIKAAEIASRLGVGPRIFGSTVCPLAEHQSRDYILSQRLSGPTLTDDPLRNMDGIKEAMDLYYKLIREGRILHMDFHSENLMFDTPSSEGEAKKRRLYILDYGLARSLSGEEKDDEEEQALDIMHKELPLLRDYLLRFWGGMPPPMPFLDPLTHHGQSVEDAWEKLRKSDKQRVIREEIDPFPERQALFKSFLAAIDMRKKIDTTIQSWFDHHAKST